MAIAPCLTKSQVCPGRVDDLGKQSKTADKPRLSGPSEIARSHPEVTPDSLHASVVVGCSSASTDNSVPVRPRRPTLTPLRMCAFEPRPFPSRELSDVPVNYVIEQLRRLAPQFWGKSDTADCTLVIPITTMDKANPAEYVNARRTLDAGRRATEPALPSLPPLILKLHSDYLSANSTLLRALFSGTSPIDLINTSQPMPPSMTLLPRVLPSSTDDHPQLFLPVPDPASIRFIIHWCYFREFRYIASYIDRGVLSWAGVVRNAQYLGLDQELKADLSRYHHRLSNNDMLVSPISSTASDSEGDADCEDSESSADEDMDIDLDSCKEPAAPTPMYPPMFAL